MRKRINISLSLEEFNLITEISEIKNKKITTLVKEIVNKEIKKYSNNIELYRKQNKLNILNSGLLKMLPEFTFKLPNQQAFLKQVKNLIKLDRKEQLILLLEEYKKDLKDEDLLKKYIENYIKELKQLESKNKIEIFVEEENKKYEIQ